MPAGHPFEPEFMMNWAPSDSVVGESGQLAILKVIQGEIVPGRVSVI